MYLANPFSRGFGNKTGMEGGRVIETRPPSLAFALTSRGGGGGTRGGRGNVLQKIFGEMVKGIAPGSHGLFFSP